MNGPALIGCAALILLLLPVVILHGERRPVPDALYALVALCGIGFSALMHGAAGLALAFGTGLASLILVTMAVAAASALWRVRLLTGGHIKLLAAGATWLSIAGALAMLLLTASLFILAAMILRARKATSPRPDVAVIAAFALLSVRLMAL